MEMEFRIGLTLIYQGCGFLEESSGLHGERSTRSLLSCSALRFIKCFLSYYLILSLKQARVTNRARSIILHELNRIIGLRETKIPLSASVFNFMGPCKDFP